VVNIGVLFERRIHQDEIAIARDQVAFDLCVALAGLNPCTDQMAQVDGERSIGLVERLALADPL
jgi:hypothetical protein